MALKIGHSLALVFTHLRHQVARDFTKGFWLREPRAKLRAWISVKILARGP